MCVPVINVKKRSSTLEETGAIYLHHCNKKGKLKKKERNRISRKKKIDVLYFGATFYILICNVFSAYNYEYKYMGHALCIPCT
jgi:hypothetical protein